MFGAEGGIRTPTLLRAPAPQAKGSERRSKPTPEHRGRVGCPSSLPIEVGSGPPRPIVLQILAKGVSPWGGAFRHQPRGYFASMTSPARAVSAIHLDA